MDDYIIMKTRIKELRLSKNLTQTALAVIIGCSQNTISRIELEETIPSSEVLIELSDYFNVSIDYLVYGKEINSIQDNLSEDEKRLLNMYSLLTDIEKGEILGELKTITKGRGE